MTTRTLYILRHADAAMPPGTADPDRPLAESGHRDAEALAARLKQDGLRPGMILCSPARRTRETCEKVRAVWPEIAASFPERLYLASAGELYETLKEQNDAHNSILLVGHNPGIHGLVQLLAGAGDAQLIARLRGGYPTGCLSILESEAENWAGILPGGCRLTGLFIGKELA